MLKSTIEYIEAEKQKAIELEKWKNKFTPEDTIAFNHYLSQREFIFDKVVRRYCRITPTGKIELAVVLKMDKKLLLPKKSIFSIRLECSNFCYKKIDEDFCKYSQSKGLLLTDDDDICF
jgi:hypothetical protein